MNSTGTQRILCLEHVALLRSRTVRRYLTKVDGVAIFEPYGAWSEGRYDPGQTDKALVCWRQALSGISVRRLTHYDHFDQMIEAGEEAIQFLETEGAALLKGSTIYRRLHKLLESDLVALALKKGLATYLKDRILFCKLVMLMAGQAGIDLIVAPAFHDGFSILPRWFSQAPARITIPKDLQQLSRRRDRLRQIVHLLYAAIGLFLRFNKRSLQSWTPLTWRRNTPVKIDWTRTINFGLSLHRSDNCLEDQADFSGPRFLYVYDWWRFDKQKVERLRKILTSSGALFVDTWQLRMPIAFYLKCKLPASWQRVLWCLESLKADGLSKLTEVAYTVLDAYVDAELFMQYYRPRVYDVRDDYLPSHVVRTLVFNRYGCKTIGIQHGTYASLGLNPYIAYTYCNTYCAYGPVYFEHIWGQAWSYNGRRALIGVERNDYAYRASRNPERREQFKVHYSGKKVLLWYPPAISAPLLNKSEKIEDMFRTVAAFLRIHRDWIVILHARDEDQRLYAAMQERLGVGARMVLEERFGTYELIVYVDAVLAPNLSTLGIEAICAGRDRVAFINYWGEWRHPFRRYDESLVVSESRQLEALLDRWARGEGAQDPSTLAEFRRDFDVEFDGRALERYKAEMRALAGLGAASAPVPVPEPERVSAGG